jgi:hypothetical protein
MPPTSSTTSSKSGGSRAQNSSVSAQKGSCVVCSSRGRLAGLVDCLTNSSHYLVRFHPPPSFDETTSHTSSFDLRRPQRGAAGHSWPCKRWIICQFFRMKTQTILIITHMSLFLLAPLIPLVLLENHPIDHPREGNMILFFLKGNGTLPSVQLSICYNTMNFPRLICQIFHVRLGIASE